MILNFLCQWSKCLKLNTKQAKRIIVKFKGEWAHVIFINKGCILYMMRGYCNSFAEDTGLPKYDLVSPSRTDSPREVATRDKYCVTVTQILCYGHPNIVLRSPKYCVMVTQNHIVTSQFGKNFN